MVNGNEKLINEIAQSGLLDVVEEWAKSEKFVRIGDIQRSFSVGYVVAKTVLDWLIEHGVIEEEPTYNRGHRVIGKALGLKIFLLDHNPDMVAAWKKSFAKCKNIENVEDEFVHFMDTHDVECIVSPANSFGKMDGGYDLAITDYFGDSLQNAVQCKIDKYFYGEQPVGTSIIVDIPGTMKKLIHTPTMRVPDLIKDPMVIYQCTRMTLMLAISEKVKSIVLPAFGAGCGAVSFQTVADMMRSGYNQILDATLN